MLRGLFRKCLSRIGGKAVGSVQPIGHAELVLAIRRERARADRTGSKFALIVFKLANGHKSQSFRDQMSSQVACRVRLVDHFSWTPGGELWLILPDCPAVASSRLAEEVCNNSRRPDQEVTYDVFHYNADDSTDNRKSWPEELRQDRYRDQAAGNKPEETVVGTPVEVKCVLPIISRPTPAWKRGLDILVSLAALTVFSPFAVVIAILIKLTSPGPVFFAQERSGKLGKRFRMLKFRTMVVNAEHLKRELLSQNEQDGPAFKMENDPRVTRIGRFLRATSMDELPQLWNVLVGDMSLVGPRPLPVDEAARCQAWHGERADVTPGLTCFWQVAERRTKVPFTDWMRMDIRYARARSLVVDCALIFRTVLRVIMGRGC